VKSGDTQDNTSLGDDHWKLVDANNNATFSTVDEMVARFTQILGLSDALNLKYHPDDQTLTFTLSLPKSGHLGQVDLPLDFNLDFHALKLSGNGGLRLTADGSLTLTAGVYLGDAPSSNMLDTSKNLSVINGGVTASTDKVITGATDVKSVYGQLSADA